MSEISLNDEHELQVQSYLRFAKLKRGQHVREAVAVITEFKEDRITSGEMYNYKEIVALLEDMSGEMSTLVDKEIQHAYHTNALVVKILLAQAQANGLQLQFDTNALENEFLLKTIASSESTALSRPASDFVKRSQTLGKVGGVSTITVSDGKASKERDLLKEELDATKAKLDQLQQQTTQMMRDRTAVNNELSALKDELATKNEALSSSATGQSSILSKLQSDFTSLSLAAKEAAEVSTQQYEDLKKQLNATRGELEKTRTDLARAQTDLLNKEAEAKNARSEAEGKVKESNQFKLMKEMMSKKSSECTELRKKLKKYEPDSVPSAE